MLSNTSHNCNEFLVDFVLQASLMNMLVYFHFGFYITYNAV